MAEVVERRLAGRQLGDVRLLDAVELTTGGQRCITLFLQGGTDATQIRGPTGSDLIQSYQIAGAPILTFAVPDGQTANFCVGETVYKLTPAEVETQLFEGANAIVAERNGEDALTVLEWLEWHITKHGLTGAVILDRAEPGTDAGFAGALRNGVGRLSQKVRIVLLSSDLPLGRGGLPAEAHPFCVPGAPGKDRMAVPAPSPWDAPLGALAWLEAARVRFLGKARAVANIDVHDLVSDEHGSVFDQAVAAQGGVLALKGRAAYPWRVRSDERAKFADHTCVQFDTGPNRSRWCIAPAKAPENAVWRLLRVGNAPPDPDRIFHFHRHMALRHPNENISQIVPKTSLVEDPDLLRRAQQHFGHKPVRVPEIARPKATSKRGRRAIVTTMKNEGPFILEWLAYHRAIGFDDFLIYTNDCTDGTDDMLDLLMTKGIVQHRDNKFRDMDLKPQHAALQMAEEEAVIRDANWVTCIDVDEFVNVKIGDGTLDALFAAVPDANMISMTWRLFGNADIHPFDPKPVIEQFTRCAPEFARKPHQAWGFKTLFQNIGLFKKLGVHRPKGLNPQLWDMINWVNGSGRALPRNMFRNGWRSTSDTYGYDLVQLNHYAVRSAESFLVKRDRGRVNHVDRDQGLAYWFRMNNNAVEDFSIQARVAMMHAERAKLLSDPQIATAHEYAVACHRAKIVELKSTENYAKFFKELTAPRLERLSRLHSHFGANVFLSGPSVIPDEILAKDPDEDWFFTVEMQGETVH